MSKPIILASSSPRRSHLLHQIGITFTVDGSNIPEEVDDGKSPQEIVLELSHRKASDVAGRHQAAYVIGADTIVVLDGAVLGKPVDPPDALRMLRLLSGRTHQVYTGFCIIETPGDRSVSDHVVTSVTFRKLSEEEIGEYVRGGSPMDKAGAYGIQDDRGAIFIERIDGCFYNVVGFPLARFHQRFLEFRKN